MGITKQDARFVLPNAVTSEIIISANLRDGGTYSLCGVTGSPMGDRTICIQMLELLQKAVPTVFSDFIIDMIA